MRSIRAAARRQLAFLPTRHRQCGLSLIGLLLSAVVIVFVALVVMKVVPSVIEYNEIRSAITKIGTSGSTDAREVRSAFDRYAAIDDITSISGKDLTVEKQADGSTVVSFQYEKRIPLFGPASLVIDYKGAGR